MKKIFVVLASVAGALSASSCGKQLEVTPPNKIYEEQIIEIMEGDDEAKKELVLNALAAPMVKYFNYWGGSMPGGVMAPLEYCYQGMDQARSLQGNDMVLGRSFAEVTELQGRNYYNGEVHMDVNTTGANSAHWFGYAYAINQANLLLKYMPKEKVPGNALMARGRASGLMIRAYSYMCLMEEFCEPFKAGANQKGMSIYTTYNPNQDPVARASADTTWKFITDDLEEAVSLTDTLIKAGKLTDDGFTTAYAELEDLDKGVACFLLARAYILSNQWEKAIIACDKIINSGKYSFIKKDNYGCNPSGENLPSEASQVVFEPQNNAFTALKKNPECILGYIRSSTYNPRTQTDRAGVQTMLQNPFGAYSAGHATVRIDDALYGLIPDGDIRKKAFYPYEFSYIFSGQNQSIVVPSYSAMKYGATCGLQDDGVTPGQKDEVDYQDFCKFRYSEVVLMKAEAYAQLNNATECQKALAPLLTARGTNYSDCPGSAALQKVQYQYRIELWGENGREYFNNKRWGIEVSRTSSNVHWNKKLHNSGTGDNALNNMILPIPNKEIETNPLCEQN